MYNITEIKDCVSSYNIADMMGIEQKRSGKVTFIRCPEPDHEDAHIGSCRITNSGYVCYACGKSGSVIDLYAKLNNFSFSQAVNELGKKLSLNESGTYETCPLTSEDKKALGLKDVGSINRLYFENPTTYHMVISVLINERIKKLTELKAQINRNNNVFIGINDDAILWRLSNLITEWMIHLEGMKNGD